MTRGVSDHLSICAVTLAPQSTPIHSTAPAVPGGCLGCLELDIVTWSYACLRCLTEMVFGTAFCTFKTTP